MLDVTLIPLSGSASQDAQWECSSIDFHRPFHHCLRWSFFLNAPVILHDHLNKKRRHAVPTGPPSEGGGGGWRSHRELARSD